MPTSDPVVGTTEATGDRGVPALCVRKDTQADVATADGKYAPPQLNASGAMRVDGSAVTQPVSGTVTITPSGTQTVAISQTGANNDVDVLSIAAGDNNIGNVDIASSLPAGTNAIGKLAANSGVDIGDVDVTSVIPGTGATNLGKAEDAAHTSGDIGVMSLGVRNDALAALTGTNLDYSPIGVTASGEVYSYVTNVLPGSAANALGKIEDAAHASGDTGVMILAVRKDSPTNLVGADGDYAPLQVDDLGGLRIGAPNNRAVSGALGALDATLTLVGDGLGSVEWEVDTGNLVGTVVFEASLDDSNWFAINAVRIDGTIIANTATFADRGTLSPTGYSRYRLRVSAYTSGTSNARMEGALSADTVRLGQALPSGGNILGYVYTFPVAGQPLQGSARSDTFTATGNGTTIDASTFSCKHFGLQVVGTGAAATTWDVRLEGSMDNVNFTQIVAHTQVTGDGVMVWSGANHFPSLYFRSRCAGLVLGGATNIIAYIYGVP